MSTETNTNSIKDHMARLRLKMVQQKIANEKDKLMNRPGTEESTSNDLENQARLQQAMLRRQELLDKIRREQLLNDEAKRPRSYSERRHYTPSPLPVPPSRRSLPDFTRFQYYNPETNRSKADVSQVRHVIEHKIKSPAPPRLPPIAHPTPRPLPPPPGVIIQPPPPPQIMHQPAPQIIQSPPQHVIQQIPQPIVQNLTGQPQESKSMFNKAEFMDMMMMQNAQMHQMMMQQLLLNQTSSGKQSPVPRTAGLGNVVHHHYTSPPASQPVHHYTTMPSMEMRAPAIRERKPQYPAPPRQRSPSVPPVVHPTPSPQPKKSNLNNRPSSMFLFGIILKEIVAALHRIYLNPSGNIYPVLNDIIGPNCYDLSALIHGGQLAERELSVLIQELQYVIENLIYHITEIMPSTGVLGTHRKSAVFELIKSGKRFPDGYFWQCEMNRLKFTEQGRTINIGDAESFLLMTGIFISRSLITTLLMKPIDYGLSTQPLSDMAERNLRIVATTLLFLVRRIAISRAQGVMPMPDEISRYLYDDNEMQHIYSRLSRTFNYCEGLLREWGTEYIRRLRASSMQQ